MKTSVAQALAVASLLGMPSPFSGEKIRGNMRLPPEDYRRIQKAREERKKEKKRKRDGRRQRR